MERKMNQLTEHQRNCDALMEAYESVWDVEIKVDECSFNEKQYKDICYHLQQVAGIIAGKMEREQCNVMRIQ